MLVSISSCAYLPSPCLHSNVTSCLPHFLIELFVFLLVSFKSFFFFLIYFGMSILLILWFANIFFPSPYLSFYLNRALFRADVERFHEVQVSVFPFISRAFGVRSKPSPRSWRLSPVVCFFPTSAMVLHLTFKAGTFWFNFTWGVSFGQSSFFPLVEQLLGTIHWKGSLSFGIAFEPLEELSRAHLGGSLLSPTARLAFCHYHTVLITAAAR